MSARAKNPTTKPPPIPPAARRPPVRDSQDDVKTSIYDSGKFPNAKPRPTSPPIQAISMKTPAEDKLAADRMTAEPEVRRPKLRAISEVSPLEHAQPQNLGYLAPPADPRAARTRRTHELVLVASLSVIVASVIALVVWFVAR